VVGIAEAGYVLWHDEKDPSPFPIAKGGRMKVQGK